MDSRSFDLAQDGLRGNDNLGSVKSVAKERNQWYVAGLHFECQQCGACCAGPSAGYIWVTRPEIKLIADFLKVTPAEIRRKFLRRVGLRLTIIEERSTKDCIFLNRGLHGLHGRQKGCMIYPVRPKQCRIWPFWPSNLKSPETWNDTAKKCPGINRGKLYSREEIQEIIKNKGKATEHTESTELKK